MASLGAAVLELATDSSKLEGGLNAAKAKTEGWAAGVSGVAKGAAIAIAAVGTAALGIVGALTASALAVAHDAGEVSKLKRELGLTTAEASKLRYEGQRMGLEVDDLSKAFGTFSKNVDNGTKAIKDNHIEVVKNKAGQVDFEKTLGGVADRFKAMPDGVGKSSLAMELFGKQGKDMIPFLNQGSTGLKAMGDEAARLGLVFDDKTLAASKRLSLAQKDLKDNLDAVKTHIGVAFLPVLAEWSGFLLSIANAVLPKVFAALEVFSGWIRTAIGVIGDMRKAASGTMVGGGDILAGIIGPKSAESFMKTVTNVSLTLNHFWETVVKPAFKWAQENIPQIWENVKSAISNMWTVVEPKLEAFVGKLGALKKTYDELPPAVQEALQSVALTAVVVKGTGVDEWLLGIANGIGGAGGIFGAIVKMKGEWTLAAANFAKSGLIVADIALIITALKLTWENIDEVYNHWENLRKAVHDGSLKNSGAVEAFLGTLVLWGDMFEELGRHTQNSIAEWQILFNEFGQDVELIWPSIVLVAQTAWKNILVGIQTMVNNGIDAINELIKGLRKIPGQEGIPLISHIDIELPDLSWAEGQLARLARNRVSTIDVHYTSNVIPRATGGDDIVTTPTLFLAGEAGPERATFTPLGGGSPQAAGTGGGGTTITGNTFVIREEADIQRVAAELESLSRSRSRSRGLPTPASAW